MTLWGAILSVCILLAGTPLHASTANPPAPTAEPRSVLMLNSYHQGFEWTDSIVEGFSRELSELLPLVDIHYEYLDSKRFDDKAMGDLGAAILKARYVDPRPDLIAVSDDIALRFLCRNMKAIYGDDPPPVVFCGVNDKNVRQRLTFPATGIFESLDFNSTIDSIESLVPDMEHLVIISDGTASGVAVHDNALAALESRQLGATLHDLGGLTRKELADRLENLPEDSVILLLNNFRTPDGTHFDGKGLARFVTTHSNAPVFSVWDIFFGHGIVGGMLTSGELHGVEMARMAAAVLQGADVNDIEPKSFEGNHFLFDLDMFRKHRLKTSALPEHSKLVTPHPTFYSRNQVIINIVGGFFIALLVITSGLLINRNKRVLAERALLEKLRFIHTLMDSTPMPIYTKDRQGRFLSCNPAMEKFLGFGQEKLLGKKLEDIFGPEQALLLQDKDLELMNTPGAQHYELQLATRSGNVDVIVSQGAYYSADGEVLGITGAISDITALKRVQRELDEKSSMLTSIINNAPLPLVALDRDLTIRLVMNPAAEVLFGWKAEEVMGKPIPWLTNSERRLARINFARMIDGNIEQGMKVEYTNRHGQLFHAALYFAPLSVQSENFHGAIAMVVDMTEREAMQHELVEARNHAQAANQAKSDFLANMSHEVRTPLNGLLGMCELLMETSLSKPQRAQLDMIHESGKALQSIVNDVLDFTKIEAGKLDLNPEDFSLQKLLESTCNVFAIMALQKGVVLERSFSETTPEVIHGDHLRIRQILLNLIGNAMKFTSNGTIRVNVDATPEDEARTVITITVSDTGCGIPEDKQQIIFDHFAQADRFLTRRHEGAGLGLAISRALAQMMEGDITVESEVGKGSTFTLSLVLENAKRNAAGVSPEEDVDLPRMHILIAEDNRINMAYVRRMLEKHGHNVTGVASGEEALEEIRTIAYDLVLMDIQMPGMDGMETTRQIRRMTDCPTSPNVPVIALTAHALKGDRERFMEAGLDGYAAKPVERRTLFRVIHRVLLDKARHLLGTDGSIPQS